MAIALTLGLGLTLVLSLFVIGSRASGAARPSLRPADPGDTGARAADLSSNSPSRPPSTRSVWPASETLYPVADTTVPQGHPTTNYGSRWLIAVGYASGSSPDWPGGAVAQGLIRFDTPSPPPDMSISKATMHLKHTATGYQSDSPRMVTAYRAADNWGELSANWNNRPGQAEAYDSVSVSVHPGQWYAFDLTDLVQGWASGHFPNYGLVVRGPESSDDIVLFQFQSRDTYGTDSDPYLVVTYTSVPTNTPPHISGLPDQQLSVNESADDAIDLWTYADDAEDADHELTFSISNAPDPGAGVALDANRYVDIHPTTNWSGTTDVAIQVVDTDGLTDTDVFQVAVGVPPGPAQGIFVDSGQLLGGSSSGVVALGDVDGDGDLDAFAGTGGPNQVWLNQKTYHIYLPMTLRGFGP